MEAGWVKQGSPTALSLTVLVAEATEVTLVTPPTIGTLTRPVMDFVGVTPSDTTAVGFSSAVDCTGTIEGA